MDAQATKPFQSRRGVQSRREKEADKKEKPKRPRSCGTQLEGPRNRLIYFVYDDTILD